jgi:DNA-binding IclR family transcriptional regulator
VRASGNPLIQANDTFIKILQTLLTEEEAQFILNFRKTRLTFQELKEKTGMDDSELMRLLNPLKQLL